MTKLHTTPDVAAALGVSIRTVQRAATAVGLDKLTERMRVYTAADIEAIRRHIAESKARLLQTAAERGRQGGIAKARNAKKKGKK
jgi:hypothetical protein